MALVDLVHLSPASGTLARAAGSRLAGDDGMGKRSYGLLRFVSPSRAHCGSGLSDGTAHQGRHRSLAIGAGSARRLPGERPSEAQRQR